MKKFILGCLLLVLGNLSIIFAQAVIPDSAEIYVRSPIIEGESSILSISILKNGSVLNTYTNTVQISIVDKDTGRSLNSNEYTLPDDGFYEFLITDQGKKTFQKGLEVKKEGTYLVKVYDFLEDNLLGETELIVKSPNAAPDVKPINLYNPTEGSTQQNSTITILGQCELYNSSVEIILDDNIVAGCTTDYMGQINYFLQNVSRGRHTLKLQIKDLEDRLLGESNVVSFYYEPTDLELFKSISVDPEEGLLVGDTVEVTVKTDEFSESVKLGVSGRSDPLIMTKHGNGEFIQKLFLTSTGDVVLSLDITSDNGNINKKYDSVKTLKVRDIPGVINVRTNVYSSTQIANITWELENGPVSGYVINYGEDETNLTGEVTTTGESIQFTNVDYDKKIFLKITPFRKDGERHGTASKIVQFVISKPVATCGNGEKDEGENCQNCPEDFGACPITCGNGQVDEGEDCQTCPGDVGDSCLVKPVCRVQAINTRTEKIGDNYFLVRDKVDNVSKYIIYSSTTPNISDRVKIFETKDTSYEYPFDKTSETDVYMYFWIDGVCDDGEEIQLESATKVQVGPTENFFLLVCLTLLIYFGIKIFRQTED